MINVLIVEDVLVTQELLKYVINSDGDLHVVGVASNGEEAIEAVAALKPDVIAMDFQMPKLNGKEATRIIMENNPTPIVIVTGSIAARDVAISFSLIEAGALAIVRKPNSLNHPDHYKDSRELIQTLKLMSEIKVVRRVNRFKTEHARATSENKILQDSDIQVVVIGASTGGPLALQKIISGLPKHFPIPIFIVQHISKGFTEGFTEWLSNTTHFPLHLATHGEYALPGHGYVAPDGFHMGLNGGAQIVLSNHSAENGLKPSISFLFRTTALNYRNAAVGILLTGMGRDGAEELKLMRDNGAVTIAQDQESSVVFGMPGEALRLNAARLVLSPEGISNYLLNLALNANKKATEGTQNNVNES